MSPAAIDTTYADLEARLGSFGDIGRLIRWSCGCSEASLRFEARHLVAERATYLQVILTDEGVSRWGSGLTALSNVNVVAYNTSNVDEMWVRQQVRENQRAVGFDSIRKSFGFPAHSIPLLQNTDVHNKILVNDQRCAPSRGLAVQICANVPLYAHVMSVNAHVNADYGNGVFFKLHYCMMLQYSGQCYQAAPHSFFFKSQSILHHVLHQQEVPIQALPQKVTSCYIMLYIVAQHACCEYCSSNSHACCTHTSIAEARHI